MTVSVLYLVLFHLVRLAAPHFPLHGLTNFYIYKQLENFEITTSTIARGIGVGDELEYADEVTLGRSILHRVPFENSLKG